MMGGNWSHGSGAGVVRLTLGGVEPAVFISDLTPERRGGGSTQMLMGTLLLFAGIADLSLLYPWLPTATALVAIAAAIHGLANDRA